MKKRFYVIAIFTMSLFFANCSSDDDSSVTPPASTTCSASTWKGTWTTAKCGSDDISVTVSDSSNAGNVLVIVNFGGTPVSLDFPATNCTFSSFGGSNPTTVTLNGSNLTITDGNDLTGCNGTITLTK